MKTTLFRIVALAAAIGLFSQPALAQDINGALKQIADIVTSINHFPSDADKAALAEIAGNDSLPQGVRDMADAVANFSHAASDQAKSNMEAIQGNAQAPDSAKTLAGIIAGMNHRASDDAKTQLAALFP